MRIHETNLEYREMVETKNWIETKLTKAWSGEKIEIIVAEVENVLEFENFWEEETDEMIKSLKKFQQFVRIVT